MTTLPPEQVHAAAAAWLFIPPGAVRVESEEYLAVRYPDYWEHPVQLVGIRPRRPIAVVLDEMLARVREVAGEHDRIVCWVRADAPDELEPELGRRGAVVDETLDVLARDLAELPELGPADLDLRWTVDIDTFRDAFVVNTTVFGGRMPDLASLESDFAGEQAKHRAGGGGAVVAYDDGRPVGVGGLSVVGPDARLWGGGVLPEARGRGVYRALLGARLEYAVAHGADLALVKGRVETSAPILRRAGFAAYGQERSYRLDL